MQVLRVSLVLGLLAALVLADTIGPMSPSRKIRTSKSGDIAVYQSRGGGTPVFLIHENSLSGATFEYLVNSFEFGGRFRVAAIDLPGHGNSDDLTDQTNYSFPNLVQICTEMVNNLGMQGGVLVGHGLGGEIAIEMLKNLPNIKLLALLDAPALRVPYSSNSDAFTTNPAVSLLSSPTLNSDQVKTVASAFFAPSFRYPDWIEPVISRTDTHFRGSLANSLQSNQYTDQYTVLRNTSIPVILFAGDADQLINTQTYFGAQAQVIPTSHKEDRNTVGHTPTVENALWVSERLAFWIDLTIASSNASAIQVSTILLLALLLGLVL